MATRPDSTRSDTTRPSITLVGCGKMGGALLRGWIAADISGSIYVAEPGPLSPDFSGHPVIQHHTATTTLPETDIIVLAVKPQLMADICATLKPAADTLILSIAAGQTIGGFEKIFGAAQPIIRAMPNTPAAIAKGMVVACHNAHVTAAQRESADQLLRATGIVKWVGDENLMDAVTALSGSGPAYVFYLIDVLAQAGMQCGLPEELSRILARQTIIGSAALAEQDADTTAETLRKNVTSPGGTTEAALNVLMNGEMQDIFNHALQAATERSKALSK